MSHSCGTGVFRVGVAAAVLILGLAAELQAQSDPAERFASAVGLVEEDQLAEARTAFEAILAEYDTPENRANIEYDSLLAGSRYYLGETYFLEDRFEDAAAQYAAVIGAFRTYLPECLNHFGLSKHYRQDYAGAIATLGELAAQYPGSPLAPQALYYQGMCYELIKDKAAARAAYGAMIEKYPQHPWTKKAITKISQGDGR